MRSAQKYARKAHDHTHGPGWWVAAHLPAVGDDATAVRSVADVTNDVATRVLPDVVDVGGVLRPDRLRPIHGRVDLAPITRATPVVVRVDRRLGEDLRRVEAIDTTGLAGPVSSPVEQLNTQLATAKGLSDTMSRAVRLLPPMLGDRGPRTYLLMFQNNAEARSAGGIPGSFAVVTARGGRVSLGKQADAAAIGRFAHSPVPLTRQERAVFGRNLGLYPQDVTFTPDFPRSAEILAAMWRAREGTKVDGVLSADPVALAHLLRGAGPVAAPVGPRLTATNVVPALLNGVYAAISEPSAQNVYFEKVFGNVFDAVAAGRGRPDQVLGGLVTSVQERRVMLWSRRPAEQALLSPTRIAGRLTSSTDNEPMVGPQVGVFLNDGGGSKLDYYLDYRVDVVSHGCHDRRQDLTVRLRLLSHVPKGAAGVPAYVKNHVAGAPPGQMRLTLMTYAPVDGTVRRATVGGRTARGRQKTHDGRTVLVQRLRLAPGHRQTLTWEMTGGQGQTGPPSLRVTPGVRTTGVGSVDSVGCS